MNDALYTVNIANMFVLGILYLPTLIYHIRSGIILYLLPLDIT